MSVNCHDSQRGLSIRNPPSNPPRWLLFQLSASLSVSVTIYAPIFPRLFRRLLSHSLLECANSIFLKPINWSEKNTMSPAGVTHWSVRYSFFDYLFFSRIIRTPFQFGHHCSSNCFSSTASLTPSFVPTKTRNAVAESDPIHSGESSASTVFLVAWVHLKN